jgi:hypothetical protein
LWIGSNRRLDHPGLCIRRWLSHKPHTSQNTCPPNDDSEGKRGLWHQCTGAHSGGVTNVSTTLLLHSWPDKMDDVSAKQEEKKHGKKKLEVGSGMYKCIVYIIRTCVYVYVLVPALSICLSVCGCGCVYAYSITMYVYTCLLFMLQTRRSRGGSCSS